MGKGCKYISPPTPNEKHHSIESTIQKGNLMKPPPQPTSSSAWALRVPWHIGKGFKTKSKVAMNNSLHAIPVQSLVGSLTRQLGAPIALGAAAAGFATFSFSRSPPSPWERSSWGDNHCRRNLSQFCVKQFNLLLLATLQLLDLFKVPEELWTHVGACSYTYQFLSLLSSTLHAPPLPLGNPLRWGTGLEFLATISYWIVMSKVLVLILP